MRSTESLLLQALKDLIEQIDTLEDVVYTRDLEEWEAEALWEEARTRARNAIKIAEMEK